VLSYRVVRLRFDAFFEKGKGLDSAFVERNPREPECLHWTEIQRKMSDVHLLSSARPLPNIRIRPLVDSDKSIWFVLFDTITDPVKLTWKSRLPERSSERQEEAHTISSRT
jgi:hypothetical protein